MVLPSRDRVKSSNRSLQRIKELKDKRIHDNLILLGMTFSRIVIESLRRLARWVVFAVVLCPSMLEQSEDLCSGMLCSRNPHAPLLEQSRHFCLSTRACSSCQDARAYSSMLEYLCLSCQDTLTSIAQPLPISGKGILLTKINSPTSIQTIKTKSTKNGKTGTNSDSRL